MKAVIKLSNGKIFHGTTFGYVSEKFGELIVNTNMFGYQNAITDPACAGSIVVMTYPLIGNYGINFDECESDSPKIRALIVNEYEKNPRHLHCELDIDSYLKSHNILGICNVDTRSLTKTIKESGSLFAQITFDDKNNSSFSKDQNSNNLLVSEVSTKKEYIYSQGNKKVAILDLGIKKSSLKYLESKNLETKVFPFNTNYLDILNYNPDLFIISSGPGNPQDLIFLKESILNISKKIPTIAIGLGHQILSLVYDGKIDKLNFTTFCNNYPVKSLPENKIYTTIQNSSYFVKEQPSDFDITFEGINIKNIQALKHNSKNIFSFQFDVLNKDFDFILDNILKGE